MRSNWNRKWICERTHIHTQHIRQMFRHSKWRTFSNLFGRLSKDDEIIYTKCVRTHERRPHAYRPQEFQQFTRFCVAPEKAWNYEGHTKQRAHARTHALRQVVCDRNMRNRFYSFGKHAFSFHLFEYFFFLFFIRCFENIRAKVRASAPFTRQWNFKRWHVWRARAFRLQTLHD